MRSIKTLVSVICRSEDEADNAYRGLNNSDILRKVNSIIILLLLFPVNCETTVVLGSTNDIFVYLVITIRCKRRVKNCKFQFDIYDS